MMVILLDGLICSWEAAVLPLYDARNLVNKTGHFLHF